MEKDLQQVEQRLADLEGLVAAMLFLGEHADDEELASLRACTVSLLHLMSDAISAANRDLAHSVRNIRMKDQNGAFRPSSTANA